MSTDLTLAFDTNIMHSGVPLPDQLHPENDSNGQNTRMGPWMVTSDDRSVKLFPKTLAGAKSMVRAWARKGVTVTIHEKVSAEGYYPWNPEEED